jgi:hypothetical protein
MQFSTAANRNVEFAFCSLAARMRCSRLSRRYYNFKLTSLFIAPVDVFDHDGATSGTSIAMRGTTQFVDDIRT